MINKTLRQKMNEKVFTGFLKYLPTLTSYNRHFARHSILIYRISRKIAYKGTRMVSIFSLFTLSHLPLQSSISFNPLVTSVSNKRQNNRGNCREADEQQQTDIIIITLHNNKKNLVLSSGVVTCQIFLLFLFFFVLCIHYF